MSSRPLERVLLAQVSPVIGDVAGNLAMCLAAVERARAAGCTLLVLPELVLSGYPPRDLLDRGDFLTACERAAEALAAAAPADLTVVFGAPLCDGALEAGPGGPLRNAAVVARSGRPLAVVPKTRLPTYDVFDEARYFTAATQGTDPVQVGGLRLGVTICEDIWDDPTDQALTGDSSIGGRLHPVDCLAHRCDLVVNLSASPFHAGKAEIRHELVRRQARRLGAPLLYCNMVGGNDELLFDGRSLVMTADGRLVAVGASFAEDDVVVDPAGTDVSWSPPSFEEEVVRALEMGIRDYAVRCGFDRGLVGLSGGVDSALVATLAVRALGADRVLTVGMPGPYSSAGSVTDARKLAYNLGTRFELVPIEGIWRSFLDALDPLFEGRPPDVTEENLQARARGTVLMALSNKLGHLLLTTGNKSEVAVGYCTLYGDMNGGLAPISDLWKTEVYRLCRWLNRDGEVIPTSILDKPPSAELAPGQLDQDKLPPYPTLDGILRLYVEGMADPAEIVDRGYDPAVVERVVRMVVTSEYKRRQMPPGLRVSPKAFGIGRRIPLAQRWHVAYKWGSPPM